MPNTLIKQLHESYLETKSFNLPPELLPAPAAFNLINWVRELYCHYREEGLVVRAFDVLPPLRLSADERINTAIQDVHAFIINDLNMIPMKIRRDLIGETLMCADAATVWEHVAVVLRDRIRSLDADEAQEELSWACSPTMELLWALSWFFMEMQAVRPPGSVYLHAQRFPWYYWASADGTVSRWEPEQPLCRPQWLAMDLLRRRIGSGE